MNYSVHIDPDTEKKVLIGQNTGLSLWGVAWRNLKRNRLRTMLLIGSVALATAILTGAYFFLVSMERSLSSGISRMGADIVVVPLGATAEVQDSLISGVPSPVYMDHQVGERVAAIPGVAQVAPQLYLHTFVGQCCGVEGEFPIVAFDPALDFTLKPWVMNTMDLASGEVAVGGYIASRGAAYHAEWKWYEDRVRILNRWFVVRGVLFPTGMGTDKTIFMTMEDARTLAASDPRLAHVKPDHISVVMVKVKEGYPVRGVAKEIEAKVEGVQVLTGGEMSNFVERQFVPIRTLLYFLTGVVLLMAILQVMAMFSAIVHERRRETGYLRAMGASRGTVARLFLTEALYSCLLGSVIGGAGVMILLYDLRRAIRELVPLPMLFPTWSNSLVIGGAAILFGVLISLLAALPPTLRAMEREPYEAIREGE